ncbi:MAG: hypothetical protein EXR76_10145 [Myxococcales bacterium]|nr:hypothetical protein [Myxococcales bacterium]
MNLTERTLYSGAAPGSEAEFGAQAEAFGLREVNFTFEGHAPSRTRGLCPLSPEVQAAADATFVHIGHAMRRQFPESEAFRSLLSSLWHQVRNGEQIFVVGRIQEDNTVTGGTGWGAEYAKQCNKPLYVFDQARDGWFRWSGEDWEAGSEPLITVSAFTGTGTRFLEENGRTAIRSLFARSFGRT